jgi:hypothetical protein
MHTVRKFFAVTLMALVVGLGAPTILAQGVAESPGVKSTTTTPTTTTADGTTTETGYIGVAESPGFMATVIVYLDVII